MAERFTELSDAHSAFIEQQKLFFVATADADSHINLSPKGMDSLKILSDRQVVWLNLTGSGNETATHVHDDGRMTIMFCSFDKKPLILRLYGKAKVVHSRDSNWGEYHDRFGQPLGARQYFVLDIGLVQTSCGFGVPLFNFVEERKTLIDWTKKTGEEGIKRYWKEKNLRSLDGNPTHLLDD